MRIQMRCARFLGLFLVTLPLPAVPITWQASESASSLWHVGTNWIGSTAPATNDSVIFSGSPVASMPLLDDIAGLSLVSISNGANYTQQLNQGLTLTGASINDGTIQFGSGSPSLTIAGSGMLTSDGILTGTGGTISVAGALYLESGSLTGGTLTGTGTVSASGTVAVSGINNSTTFGIAGGTTTLQGTVSNSGVFDNTGGTLDLADALSLSGGGSLTGNATNVGTATFSNITYSNGILRNTGATIDVGTQNLILQGSGGSSGDILGGTVATSLGGLVEALGNTILDTTSAGTYNLMEGNGSTQTNLTVQGDTLFDIQSGNMVEVTNNASLSLYENVQNDGGTFQIDDGGSVDPANFVQNSGSTKIDGSATFTSIKVNGGSLEMSGDESGDLTGEAGGTVTVDPGGIGVVGTLTEQGNFSESNALADSLTIDILGKSSSQYDTWDVSSLAEIDGTLNLDFGGGYVPQAGDTYTILSSGGLSGAFSAVNLVGANGATAAVSYGAEDVTVSITQSGATPEPAAWSLMALGLAAGLATWRRNDLRRF